VGGDLSLVPAYEQAGDKWLDADGKVINTAYGDGMITYVHEVAGWNSVRVRLLVDPSLDDAPATCQDLDYVKKLGKRVKDAGMNFLLDIFYSDTWTDVSQQWIPTSWGYDRNTAQATLAAKVKNYTTEVLNELAAYGAKPDYVQIGNEVSYGMLWDSLSGKNKANSFSTGMTYDGQRSKIERFATLLKAAAEGVRASECATAKIVLHCERTINSTQVKNFYSWVQQAGFTDYDIIGLSYYPIWHGTISQLKSSLSALQASFPSKDIHIVETGYFNNTGVDASKQEYNTSSTWPFSFEGQAKFIKDLVDELAKFKNVKGLYYWQPEECGNGADEGGTNRVMNDWDNRGFWELTWKSGNHKLLGGKSLTNLKEFLTTTGISSVNTKHADNDTWYTLDGRRLNGKPAARGLYIHNGKKIIVK
jgi:arabinogalactan endo-1,4-beta-galactosidase